LSMKNKLLGIGVACGLGSVAFLLSACPKNGIVILPVNGAQQQHFENKWAVIKPILNTRRDELFYIQYYSEGKPSGDPLGSLPPILLEQSKTDFERLVDPRFSGHAFQIGVGLSKAKTSVSFIGTLDHASHLHLIKNIAESAELVKAVNKELDTTP
jgi:hypothetical protein